MGTLALSTDLVQMIRGQRCSKSDLSEQASVDVFVGSDSGFLHKLVATGSHLPKQAAVKPLLTFAKQKTFICLFVYMFVLE